VGGILALLFSACGSNSSNYQEGIVEATLTEAKEDSRVAEAIDTALIRIT
jgi:hypothetical protein